MIRTQDMSFKIGSFSLTDFNVHINRGEYFVMLGPPGSGKSIFLECLCGLKRINSGSIFIDGQDVTKLEPRMRQIGYVPQDYAVFPHLTVRQNIEFGLKVHGVDKSERIARVNETAEMLGIAGLLSRTIHGLSGGERQRVALGRALVLKPRILLLDEPVCALDEATRQAVCSELSAIHRKFNLTTIHVSHNLEEAFSIADKAAVLCDGRVAQSGTMSELMREPNSEFVARFMRCENVFAAESVDVGSEGDTTVVNINGLALTVKGSYAEPVKFMIRPENITLFDGGSQPEITNAIAAKVVAVRDCGNYIRVDLDCGSKLVAHTSQIEFAKSGIKCGSEVTAVLATEHIYVIGE